MLSGKKKLIYVGAGLLAALLVEVIGVKMDQTVLAESLESVLQAIFVVAGLYGAKKEGDVDIARAKRDEETAKAVAESKKADVEKEKIDVEKKKELIKFKESVPEVPPVDFDMLIAEANEIARINTAKYGGSHEHWYRVALQSVGMTAKGSSLTDYLLYAELYLDAAEQQFRKEAGFYFDSIYQYLAGGSKAEECAPSTVASYLLRHGEGQTGLLDEYRILLDARNQLKHMQQVSESPDLVAKIHRWGNKSLFNVVNIAYTLLPGYTENKADVSALPVDI